MVHDNCDHWVCILRQPSDILENVSKTGSVTESSQTGVPQGATMEPLVSYKSKKDLLSLTDNTVAHISHNLKLP
jgi:hypothetical protein